METIVQLEKKLAEPSAALIEDIAKLDGDIIILGVGGKVGPGLARQPGQPGRPRRPLIRRGSTSG